MTFHYNLSSKVKWCDRILQANNVSPWLCRVYKGPFHNKFNAVKKPLKNDPNPEPHHGRGTKKTSTGIGAPMA